MKKHFLRLATAFLGFSALAIAAKAQVPDQLLINIPYEFVVGGKTLPPGTYRVNRVSDFTDNELVLSNFANRAGALVIATEVEDARVYKPGFTFEEIGGQHFLTKIETADHVFAIRRSRSAALEAAMKSHQGSTGSAASGSN